MLRLLAAAALMSIALAAPVAAATKVTVNGVAISDTEIAQRVQLMRLEGGGNTRQAMEQIVEYKNDPGNGYARTLLCFIQLFIVSNRDHTYYFANNNARHFTFNSEER